MLIEEVFEDAHEVAEEPASPTGDEWVEVAHGDAASPRAEAVATIGLVSSTHVS